MAVRFDASGEHYTRAITIGAVADWSAALWVKMVVDRAATTVLWQIDDGTGATFLRVSAWNGSALAFQTTGSTWFGVAGHTLLANEWTFVGLSATANPGQARVRIRPAGSTTFVGGSPTQANVTFTANSIRIAGTASASEWLNGSIAGVKMWNAALTEDELELESWTYMPQRTTNLRVWYPLLTPSNVDYSGNGETTSGGAGAAVDDGPPVTWRQGRRRIFIPGFSISGDLAGTLPPPTATAAGTVKAAGTLAGVLPAVAATMVGDVHANTLIGVLPAATASMAAAVKVTGTTAATLPAATGVLTADVEIPVNDITLAPGTPARRWTAGAPARGWEAATAKRGWKAVPPT